MTSINFSRFPVFAPDHPKYGTQAQGAEGKQSVGLPEPALTKRSAEDVLMEGWSGLFNAKLGGRTGSSSSIANELRSRRQDSQATLYSVEPQRASPGKIQLIDAPSQPTSIITFGKSAQIEDEKADDTSELHQHRPSLNVFQPSETGNHFRHGSDATLVDVSSFGRRRSSAFLDVRSPSISKSRQPSVSGRWASTLAQVEDEDEEDIFKPIDYEKKVEQDFTISFEPVVNPGRDPLNGGIPKPMQNDNDEDDKATNLTVMEAQVLAPENAVIAQGLPPSVQNDHPVTAGQAPAVIVKERLPALNIPKDLRVTRNLYTVRPLWLQRTWQYGIHTLQASIVYFFLIGFPLWDGAVYSFWIAYHSLLHVEAGAAIFVGIALFYSVIQLTCLFESAPDPTEDWKAENRRKASEMAVLIPCYKSASIVGATIEACLKTFPARNIFVIANGNSETPLDNTEEVCNQYGVRHIWVPIGSKITAQFFGCQYASEFKYCLLIDDDVHIPDIFPIVTERIKLGKGIGGTKCIGYCIKSTGPDGIPGSMCQQAQDIEYKLSGLARTFCGRWGSATFPHGAIAIWEREFLEECFRRHPGFTISEDWFFGLVCRKLGGRIEMCSLCFVETETPINMYRKGEAGRAGYGEMTVTSQRFSRWNFFLVSRTYHNLMYIFFSWKMGIYELSCKLWILSEVYTTLMMLSMPFILPVTLAVAPAFTFGLMAATEVMYFLIVVIFNEIHLRRRDQRVSLKVVCFYYIPYKLFLRGVNVLSCYMAIYKYARYYRKHHPKILGNEQVVNYMNVLAAQSHTQYSDDANPLEERSTAPTEECDLEGGLVNSSSTKVEQPMSSPRSSISDPFSERSVESTYSNPFSDKSVQFTPSNPFSESYGNSTRRTSFESNPFTDEKYDAARVNTVLNEEHVTADKSASSTPRRGSSRKDSIFI